MWLRDHCLARRSAMIGAALAGCVTRSSAHDSCDDASTRVDAAYTVVPGVGHVQRLVRPHGDTHGEVERSGPGWSAIPRQASVAGSGHHGHRTGAVDRLHLVVIGV